MEEFQEPCPFVGLLESIVSPVKDLLWSLLIPLVLLNLENKLTCYATYGWVFIWLGTWVGGGGDRGSHVVGILSGFHRKELGT